MRYFRNQFSERVTVSMTAPEHVKIPSQRISVLDTDHPYIIYSELDQSNTLLLAKHIKVAISGDKIVHLDIFL